MERVTPQLQRLATEDPRLAAVLAGAMIEEQLYKALNIHRVPSSSEISSRTSASNLRSMAHRFGLIHDNLSDEIDRLNTIRNKFAHSSQVDLDFDSPEISSSVKDLNFSKHFFSYSAEQAKTIIGMMGSNRGRWYSSVCAALSSLQYLIEVIQPIGAPGALPAIVVHEAVWFTVSSPDRDIEDNMKFKVGDKITVLNIETSPGQFLGQAGMHGMITAAPGVMMSVQGSPSEYYYTMDLWSAYDPDHVTSVSFPESYLKLRQE